MAHENPFPGENNTGHFWDEDLRELDNPPPLWWMLALYGGFVMILFYAIYYPAIPLMNDFTKGVAGWTAVTELKEDTEILTKYREHKFAQQETQISTLSATEITKDAALKDYANATSKMLFGDYCAACHGAGGMGNANFPILADDDWLFGGDAETIHTTLVNGRKGNMPSFASLNEADTTALVDYVVALAEGNASAASMPGATLYMTNGCIGCHGAGGVPVAQMKPFMGAAQLNDQVWRFNVTPDGNADLRANIEYTIKYGVNQANDPRSRQAIMPSFKDRLSDKDLKRLAVYVHSLGGGQ